MTEVDEQIRKKQLPCIFSMGHIDLIFQLEFEEKDLQKPLSNSSNMNNINEGEEDISYYNFGDINSIKDLYFIKKKKSVLNKIKLKPGNQTLNQILTGNEQLETKCIVDYIGYGPLKFENDESFFKDIFKYVTLKNFLIINEKFLDKNSPSSFSIELTYQGNSKTIIYEPPPPEKEEEKNEKENINETENLRQSQNKPNLKRSESILNNLIPSLKRYELVFINYTDIEQKQQQLFTVYHNYEIVSSKIGKTFKELNKVLTNGIINDGKIIINFPYSLNNNKDIWVICNIINENIFIPEYYFIYNQKKNSLNHINYIFKYIGLQHYLNKLVLINNTIPIMNETDNFKIIGTIVKCETNNFHDNKN
jgi:hypothetical protein